MALHQDSSTAKPPNGTTYNVWYPANDDRQKRAETLILMIGEFQDNMKRAQNDFHAEEERLVTVMNEIATRAGYPTIDAYVDSALNILTPEQKAEFYEFRDKIVAQDSSLKTATQVGGMLAGIGTFAGVSAAIVKLCVMDKSLVVIGMRAIAAGIAKIVSGSVEVGIKLIGCGTTGLKRVFSAAGTIGEDGAKALKFFKFAGKWLTVAGFLLELGDFIAQAIIGSQVRDELRKNIKEFCSRRFSAYATQLKIGVIGTFRSSGIALIQTKAAFDELVANGNLSPNVADETIKSMFLRFQDQLKSDMIKVDNSTVLKGLSERDGINAWTNEDPDLPTMLQWIEENTEHPESLVVPRKFVTVVPWNWNPEGDSDENLRSIMARGQLLKEGQRALDWKSFRVRSGFVTQ